MNRIIKQIPNTITLCNLLCGCLAAVNILNGDPVGASYLVGLALIFDFLDGLLARLLKVSSAIGKDLDSLADMITFGFVPGLMMYSLISNAVHNQPAYDTEHPGANNQWLPYIGFMITIFSAIRLARFNNDPRQHVTFIGMPTPANSILICSLPILIYSEFRRLQTLDENQDTSSIILSLSEQIPFLIIFTVISSLLLIAPIPLIALKFKKFAIRGNEMRYLLVICSVLMLIIFKVLGIPLIIVLYLLLSIINNLLFNKKIV